MIKVLVKFPGEDYKIVEVDKRPSELEKLIGGKLKINSIFTDARLITRADVTGCEYNTIYLGCGIYGPLAVVGYGKDGFSDIPEILSRGLLKNGKKSRDCV